MVDQAANFVRGNADAAIGVGDTTISVVDATEFPDPANGEYNLTLWNGDDRPDQDPDAELVRVTGRDTGTNDLTVTRAQEGTSDVSHPIGSALQLGTSAKVISDLASQFTNIEVFTADGTFDATGIDTAFVEVVGGGGGAAGDGSGSPFGGAAGGGGGYAADTVDISNTNSETVTVGSGGAGGGAGDNAGANGSSSSFGTRVEAAGGIGGSDSSSIGTEAAGGVGTTGSIQIAGGRGEAKVDGAFNSGSAVEGASGGGTALASRTASIKPTVSEAANGLSGNFPGGGGSGGVTTGSAGQTSGGDGADGVVIVRY